MSDTKEFKDSVPKIRLAIVGRPNVGKSTLFNRLLGRRRALVHDLPGVTRDRLVERAEWWVRAEQIQVDLIDTGGIGGEHFNREITEQARLALREAQAVIVLFDGQQGLTPLDRDVLKALKTEGLLDKRGIALIGAVNKVDDEKHEGMISDFYETGLPELLTLSAEHGRGIEDLKEKVVELWNELPDSVREQASDEDLAPAKEHGSGKIRIAIVGKPNVGKSTLVNAILGENRMIVSPIAGTTIDSVDHAAQLGDHEVILIDTAGIRRKSKTEQGVEVLSVVQSRKALERCDVAILLMDGELGVADQDEKIGGLIQEVGCGVILAVNKWDMQKKNPKFTREIAADVLRKKMAYLRYAPILFLSAKEGKGFEDLGELAAEIVTQRQRKVSTRDFTEMVRRQSEVHNPMNAKFYMCHQSGKYPPTFVCHVSDPKKVHFSLERHIMNCIRAEWGFMGNPVRLHFVQGSSERKADPKKARKQIGRQQRSTRNREEGRN
jgi:GTP-binding protein